MNSIKILINLFFLILILNETYSQTLNDKYALFDSLAAVLAQNVISSGLLPISTITTNTSCQSTCPCSYLVLPIINLTNKQLNVTYIDWQGNMGFTTTTTADAGPIPYTAYQNGCFKIKLDANDPNSQSIYIKLPLNNGSYFIGDIANLKQNIFNSSWLNNSNLTIQHLQQVKALADYQKVKPIQPDLQLIRSSYYDDSVDSQQLIKTFFNSFNSTNKFIDPLFNPLNGVSGYSAVRVSELVIQIPKNYNNSVNLGGNITFTLNNDLTTDFTLYWIDFSGALQNLGSLARGQKRTDFAFLGKVLALDNNQKTYLIQIGNPPFVSSNVVVNVSQIANIFNYSISNPYAKPIVIDRNNLQYDTSDQGAIGNCYMDSALTSIYTIHPDLILDKFIMPELMNETGIVAVKFWSKFNQQWRLVVMDDYLNKASYYWQASSPSGEFGNIFWHPFLEKAFAKQVTSFNKLTSGQSYLNNDVIWNAMLGPRLNQEYYVTLNLNDSVQSNNIINIFQNGGMFSFQTFYPSNGFNSSLTCLINLHAYGLVDLRVNVANSGLSFVRVQNPWGHNGEWCGDWGDSSPLWDQYPAIKKELNFVSKNDGAFWFDVRDAGKLFTLYTAATVKTL